MINEWREGVKQVKRERECGESIKLVERESVRRVERECEERVRPVERERERESVWREYEASGEREGEASG